MGKDYEIKIELLSETILGSGEALAGFVDLDVLYDDLGLPFLKGKTLKGRLREEAENIARLQPELFNKDQVNALFGKEDNDKDTILAFSNCEVSPNIKEAIKNSDTNKMDILDSLTEVRSFTSIGDNGVAKDGSLRQIRVINKGLKLYCNVTVRGEITGDDLLLLGLATLSLKHIGLMCNRGKGNIKCTLIGDGKILRVKEEPKSNPKSNPKSKKGKHNKDKHKKVNPFKGKQKENVVIYSEGDLTEQLINTFKGKVS